jgi:arylsulfatase A-like enzyme
MTRRRCLSRIGLGIAGSLGLGCLDTTEKGRIGRPARGRESTSPNFVLILADDLGYGDIGCYGNPKNKTPHLDRLAREGMRFTDFHANGPMCSPTRAALLTGQYQHRFGKAFEGALSAKTHTHVGLPSEVTTLPEMLKDVGYTTGMFGKWHLGYQSPHLPTQHGFDEFRGLLTGDGDHHSHISRSGDEDWWHNEQIEMETGYSVDLLTQHSIDFMTRNRHRPFFLYVAHLAIHFPWQAPQEQAHRVKGHDYWNLSKLGPHDEGQVEPVVRQMVEAVDASTGRIVAALKQLGLEDNTFVFFVSDNGGYLDYAGRFAGEISSNGPFRGQKGEVFEGGHRVPAIAWWPGRIEAGLTHETAMTMDLLPTYAGLAGVAPIEGVDGTTLAPLLLDNQPLPRRDVFWRKDENWAVRRGPWKLVGSGSKMELFNLDDDVAESRDRATQHSTLVTRLLAAFRRWEQDVNERP